MVRRILDWLIAVYLGSPATLAACEEDVRHRIARHGPYLTM